MKYILREGPDSCSCGPENTPQVPGQENEVAVKTFEANSHEDAMRQMHEHYGWDAYVPNDPGNELKAVAVEVPLAEFGEWHEMVGGFLAGSREKGGEA